MSNKTNNIAQFLNFNSLKLNLNVKHRSILENAPDKTDKHSTSRLSIADENSSEKNPVMSLKMHSERPPPIDALKETSAGDKVVYHAFPKIGFENAFKGTLRGEHFHESPKMTTEETPVDDLYMSVWDKITNGNFPKHLTPETADTWNKILYQDLDVKRPTTAPKHPETDNFHILFNSEPNNLLTKPTPEKTPTIESNNPLLMHNINSKLPASFGDPQLEAYFKLLSGRVYNTLLTIPSSEETPRVDLDNPLLTHNIDTKLPASFADPQLDAYYKLLNGRDYKKLLTKPTSEKTDLMNLKNYYAPNQGVHLESPTKHSPIGILGHDYNPDSNRRDFKWDRPTRRPYPDIPSYEDLRKHVNINFDELPRHKWYPPSVPTFQTFDWDKLDHFEKPYAPNMSWNNHKSGKEITSSVFLAVLLVVGGVYLLHAMCRRLSRNSKEDITVEQDYLYGRQTAKRV